MRWCVEAEGVKTKVRPKLSTSRLFCLLLQLRFWSVRGASHHLAFAGNCQTISHTFYSLISPLGNRKWDHLGLDQEFGIWKMEMRDKKKMYHGIPTFMSLDTSLPPRLNMPSSGAASMTIPLPPSIPPHTHLSWDVAGTPTIEALGDTATILTKAKRSHHYLAILNRHNHEHNSFGISIIIILIRYTHPQDSFDFFPHSNRSGISPHRFLRFLFLNHTI